MRSIYRVSISIAMLLASIAQAGGPTVFIESWEAMARVHSWRNFSALRNFDGWSGTIDRLDTIRRSEKLTYEAKLEFTMEQLKTHLSAPNDAFRLTEDETRSLATQILSSEYQGKIPMHLLVRRFFAERFLNAARAPEGVLLKGGFDEETLAKLSARLKGDKIPFKVGEPSRQSVAEGYPRYPIQVVAKGDEQAIAAAKAFQESGDYLGGLKFDFMPLQPKAVARAERSVRLLEKQVQELQKNLAAKKAQLDDAKTEHDLLVGKKPGAAPANPAKSPLHKKGITLL